MKEDAFPDPAPDPPPQKDEADARRHPPPDYFEWRRCPTEPEAVERAVSARAPRQGEMTPLENRVTWTLCGIYSIAILGLYMVLPILSPYANSLPGRTDLLVGMSIGAYGLTQTLFQVPMGTLSDRIGRKRSIFIGLLFFAAGGAISALATRIEVLIIGRLVQGAGAVASTVASLVADLTRPTVRTQAMARIGVAIGGSFAIGMIGGPILAHQLGPRIVFVCTTALSVIAAAVLLAAIPNPRKLRIRSSEQMHATDLRGIVRQKRVLLLYGGTFLLHNVVTVLFVMIPFDLARESRLVAMWKIVVPAVAIGLVTMAVTARVSDRKKRPELVLAAGSFFLLASCVVMGFFGGRNLTGTLVAVLVFVLAVALLEPSLPSIMTRFAVEPYRGTAMGMFSMSQFLGTFSGGMLGGAFLNATRAPLFLGYGAAVLLWAVAVQRTGGWRPPDESALAPETV